ncbi:SH3 domain-containing protein [Bdellovibrionota bacterium FG-1]
MILFRIFLKAVFSVILFAILGAGLITSPAYAVQNAKVMVDASEVHQMAGLNSPVLGVLARDTALKISSGLLKDAHGEYWYKMRMESGVLGYVQAKDVAPEKLDEALKGTGHQPLSVKQSEPVNEGRLPSIFLIRAMGVGGYEFTSDGFEAGFDGEFSVSLLPFSHGYRHRMLSLGVAVESLWTDTSLMGSFIYRIYSGSRVEPEVRVRFGQGLNSSSLVVGGNFGVDYPFSLDSGAHLSGYVEAGVLTGINSGAPTHVSVLAGLGFHF